MNDKLYFILIGIGLLVGTHLLFWTLFKSLVRLFYKPTSKAGEKAMSQTSNSLKWGLFFVLFPILEPYISPEDWSYISKFKVFQILFIVNLAWILISFAKLLKYVFLESHSYAKLDNLRERSLYTQVSFIQKILVAIIVLIAFSAIMMNFDEAKKLGQGLLTSAGVAGIIIGLAAQKSIANFLAGFQIAFTQPIRIDDVVVVEGEWGKIEEINFTYVVVCIWDQRRLVLPINYFLEKPFQNWTRNTADIWGTVFLYVDHTIPVADLKAKLKEILGSTDLWDGKVQVLQVTDVKEATVELRCLMSAKDSPSAFDLRCMVREQMITYIQEKYPDSLPKARVLLHQTDEVKST
ncbi:mechanosensitive ion channel family protein [Echinicola strongylocentroti]|uniref:Mechanosensitive ion channel family protein n=1 Tax=Echinicola strongylocentroti TaxID=1795355 RepID=A0A2Z4IIB8_9BACT|nr:mechanosensitive ion channel domain-containing protein [Echinicola strongylocentroti]AWW30457.1 mechanosensitive ion channel family protein [Echinicola strongylocentroti]